MAQRHHPSSRPLRAAALVAALLLISARPAAGAADTLRLSLADAVRTAFESSPTTVQASATRTGGVTTLARGINNLLPSASGSIGYDWQRTGAGPDSTDSGWSASLIVSQVVFSPSAFAGLVTAAVRNSYSRTSARDQEARLVYDVTVDYLNLVKYDRLREVADAALRRAEENLELVRAKQQRGLASSIDVLRAEAQEAQAQLGLLEAEQDLGTGTETFKADVGLGRDVVVVPTESLAAPREFAVGDPDSMVAEIERLNPGTRMAAQSRNIARVSTAATVGAVLPDVSLQWQRSASAGTLPDCVGEWRDNGTTSYGLRANLPLLDLKSYVLDVVDAANDARRADATARLAELQLHATAVTAVAAYRSARERYDLASATLALNERLHRLAQEQLRLGSISQLDFLDVEADLVSAQASQVSAVCDTYIRAANISYLLGTVETGD
jgi:outer membrane protein TolC